MPRIGPLRGACKIFDSAVAQARAMRDIPEGYSSVRRRTGPRLAFNGSAEDVSRLNTLEAAWQESFKGRTASMFRTASFQLSPFEVDALRLNWRKHLTEGGKQVFDRHAATALPEFQLRVQQHTGTIGKVIDLSKRGRKLKTPGWLVAASLNFAPAAELIAAAKLPAVSLAEKKLRNTTFRSIMRKTNVGVNEMNKADILSFGHRDYKEFFKHVDDGITDLTATQIENIADSVAVMGDLYSQSRTRALVTFRQANPAKAATMTEEEMLAEMGIGPTLFSYYPHVFNADWERGYGDYLMEMARGTGLFNHTAVSPHVPNQNMIMSDVLRLIGSKTRPDGSYVAPIQLGNRTAHTADEAIRLAFPGLHAQGPEAVRLNLFNIRRAAAAADDTGIFQARNPRLWNQYLLDRHGTQGFTTDFWTAFEAYGHASSRQIHLDPLFAPNGAVSSFVNAMGPVDSPAATTLANHFRQIVGLSPMNDQAFRDFAAYSHVIAGNAYAAISRLNPGIALPNTLSPIMYGIPEALRDGFENGGRDLFASLFMYFDPAFQKVLKHTELANTYTFNETASDHMARRLWAAWDDGDLRGAATIARESLATYSDLLSLVESKLVRPWGAALGAARFVRRNNLQNVDIASLSNAQKNEMMHEMINVVAKSTILGATSNAVPALRFVRRIPVVGPVASMFTTTPVNIAAHMTTNFKAMLVGPPEMRAEALRVFSAQAAMGTLVAGPFWFFPWIREMESTEDREALIGALNAWERNFSLAGWLGTDLSRRLSPITGVTERFLDNRAGVAGLAFGPLGGAVNDVIAAAGFTSDDAARRRAAGAFAPLLFDLPPSGVLPSPVQNLLPAGGVGIEKLLRTALATHADPRGYVSLGPLGFPVKNPSGYKVDALGRPYATTSPGKEFRRFSFGGRDILDAVDAAEGIRTKKRVDSRRSVEGQLRRTILDGDFERTLAIYEDNAQLQPVITESELEREKLMRALPPEARAVFTGELINVVPRIRTAVERLSAGGLSPEQEKEERAVAVVGILKLNRARPPKGVVLGPGTRGPTP